MESQEESKNAASISAISNRMTLSSHTFPDGKGSIDHMSKFGNVPDAHPPSPSISSCSSERSCCHDSACNLLSTTPIPRSEACSLDACLNPEICDKLECCDDEACIHPSDFPPQEGCSAGHASDITEEERDDFADLINYDTAESSGSMPCQWLETDHQCSVTGPPAAISKHVYKDHIEQSTWLPCEWAQCDQTIESQHLLQHVVQEHRLDQYVCLWQGCGYSFSSDEELAAHMSAMHCSKLDCHWGGCEFIDMDPAALKTHVTDEHLNLYSNSGFLSHPYSNTLSATPLIASKPQLSQVSRSPSFSIPPSPHNSFQNFSGPPKIPSGGLEKHQCLWRMTESAHSICATCFSHENELQGHVEKAHLSDLSARSHPLGSAAFVCRWQGCKAKGSSHNGKDKLRKHTYTHTGCKNTKIERSNRLSN